MPYSDLLARFVQMGKSVLQDNLAGIYLHGSAAMGCFNPRKSDLDLILLVEKEPSDTAKLAFMDNVIRLNEEAPPKGIELSIVKKEYCRPFVYPTPFELHFSPAHLERFKHNPREYLENMKGTDKDLAAHFTVIRQYGVVLFGEDAADVFGEVPKAAYIDSIWRDIENACEDIEKDPVYIGLNLCRVLAYLQSGLVLSKKAGGEWALGTLPKKYHALLQTLLQNYASDEDTGVSLKILQDFSQYMMGQIQSY